MEFDTQTLGGINNAAIMQDLLNKMLGGINKVCTKLLSDSNLVESLALAGICRFVPTEKIEWSGDEGEIMNIVKELRMVSLGNPQLYNSYLNHVGVN